MICPNCNSENTIVKDSRPTENNTRRRRYECMNCLHKFTTVELCKDTYDKQVKPAQLVAELANLVKVGCSI